MKRALMASCVLALAQPAHAIGRLADITVVDRASGATLPVYHYRGEYWVPGTPGGRYAISIRNNLGARVLAVTSVDGINVITGDTARWDQTGYVFGSQEGYQIIGWRKSQADVADFEFDVSRNSYAERTGRPANVGIIGVALFRERAPDVARQSLAAPPAEPPPVSSGAPRAGIAEASKDSASMAPRSLADSIRQPAAKLGTGFGEREWSSVTYTEFQRASNSPDEIVRIRYDSRENLIAMGVIRLPPTIPPGPNPFPDSPVAHYVPDPPPYR